MDEKLEQVKELLAKYDQMQLMKGYERLSDDAEKQAFLDRIYSFYSVYSIYSVYRPYPLTTSTNSPITLKSSASSALMMMGL